MKPGVTPAANAHPREKMVWLVGVHVAIGLVAAMATEAAFRPALLTTVGPSFRHSVTVFRWWQTVLLGIIFAQTTLLGICVGLEISRWCKRLYWLIGGLVCILLLLTFSRYRPLKEICTVAVLSTFSTAIMVFVPRISGSTIQLEGSTAAPIRPVQFSLRQLMVATLLIGCLVTVARALPPKVIYASIEAIVIAAGIGWLGLVPVWPALATKHSTRNTIVSVVIVSSIAYCFERYVAGRAEAYVSVGITIGLTVIAISLLVVHFWGYRLTRAFPRT